MNKADLIETLREESGLTRSKAEAVVEILFGNMADALTTGDRIEIRGFCSFFVKHYGPYAGRNPKTREPVQVEAKKLPFFKCGNEFKERVDYKQT
jgi:integration host factor subunit beta